MHAWFVVSQQINVVVFVGRLFIVAHNIKKLTGIWSINLPVKEEPSMKTNKMSSKSIPINMNKSNKWKKKNQDQGKSLK